MVAVDPADAIAQLRTPEGWLRASSVDGRFGSLFGRDSLISALQLLPVDPSIAGATLTRLGAELGTRVDPLSEEEPGKVLHEARDDDLDVYVRFGWPVRDGHLRYYGSIDAGLWFLIVLGALARGGHDIRPHRDAGRRVAQWLAGRPMPLAYRRTNPSAGLQHQGWRDVTWDLEGNGHGVVDESGAPMRTPVALASVQALAWRALHEAAWTLDPGLAVTAERARAVFLSTFVGEGDVPAFARHRGGMDHGITSDLGHILWTGILDGTPASAATEARLHAPDLLTPFGLRTLSSDHAGFRPDGYHTGAVWPFDSWLGGAVAGVVEAVERLGGFPELYVVERDGTLRPSAEACAVQAWTVGAVVAIQQGWDGRAWAL